MSMPTERAAIERFGALIARRLGLQFDDSRAAFLAEILRHAARDIGLGADAYLDRLTAADEARREWRALAHALTVTETYFFRHNAQFLALRDFVSAEWPGTRLAARPLSILSAGCASGEEPYSIAMLLRDVTMPGGAPAIHGIDINTAMLFKAAAGHYSPWSLRETPAARRTRYFTAQGNDCVLDPGIRNAVTFEERYLNADDAGFWRPGAFDIVFCRNVLMYFTRDAARAAIARIAASLAPGGLLFLGHAETLRGLSADFHLRHTHGTFYYQRRETLADRADPSLAAADPVWDAVPPATDGAGPAWYDIIEGAAGRVRAMTARPASRGAPLLGAAPHRPRDLAQAMVLLAGERYGEALALLDSLPPAIAQGAEALFLRGVLLMNRGELAGAERLCRDLLARDGMGAGAHYLMALCREADGDCHAAATHDRRATDLDPHFAMPRLHLGLLARRIGDRAAARRELTRAAALLPEEQADRLVLFGGGFGREALMALCQAELASADGAP